VVPILPWTPSPSGYDACGISAAFPAAPFGDLIPAPETHRAEEPAAFVATIASKHTMARDEPISSLNRELHFVVSFQDV
jgi:hypothetical protein